METETHADIMLWLIPAVPWVIPLKPLLRGYLLLNCRELALRVSVLGPWVVGSGVQDCGFRSTD